MASGYPYDDDDGDDNIIFICEYGRAMKLVGANIKGVSISSTGTQIEATNCSSNAIVTEAAEWRENGFPLGSLYVSTSGNFVRANIVYKYSGVPLSTPWVFMEIQPIRCSAGYSLNKNSQSCEKCLKPSYSTGGSGTNCSICVSGYYMDSTVGVCSRCPLRTTICDAGTTLESLVLTRGSPPCGL